MSYRLSATEPDGAAQGFELFRRAYLRAREANPLVPPLDSEHASRLRARVQRAFDHGGVAAWRGEKLVGYMVAGPRFEMRGLSASLVPEYGHAIAPDEDVSLVGRLYAWIAERMVREGVQLHLVGHFAADARVRAALVELGFGGVVAERLRDLSDVRAPTDDSASGDPEERIVRMRGDATWRALAALAAEHAAYYRTSPLFAVKDESLESASADLEAHRSAGDRLFVYREAEEALAYLIVGDCPGETEGRLLAGTRTAQVRSAYVRPSIRRRGIGSALLQRAVTWAREAGYERLFVEHETANLEGGPFWRRHFRPFVDFSMRYVDRTL